MPEPAPAAAIRHHYADGPHGQVHVAVAGAGAPLVLLGGAPRSGRQFEALVPFLAGRHRMIMPDMPGFGNSAPIPDGAGLSEVARSIVAVLDGLKIDRAHLFGLHSGAKVSAALAAEAGGRCSSVVIAGKSHSLIPDMARRAEVMRAIVEGLYFADGADEGFDSLRGWAAAGRVLSRYWWDDALFRAEDVPTALRAVEARVIDDLLGRRNARAFYEANFTFDFADAVRRIAVPAMILEITGDREDAVYGRQGERLRALLPTARMENLPDVDPAGLGVQADPAALARLIGDFIAGVPA
ncbi:alpha/beta fold hydrolase [Sphingomonas sp. YL-JM2C]